MESVLDELNGVVQNIQELKNMLSLSQERVKYHVLVKKHGLHSTSDFTLQSIKKMVATIKVNGKSADFHWSKLHS